MNQSRYQSGPASKRPTVAVIPLFAFLSALILIASNTAIAETYPGTDETAFGKTYSVSQLADMSKEQLIEVVVALQHDRYSRSQSDGTQVPPTTLISTDRVSSPHHSVLPIIAAAAGGLVIASIAIFGHHGTLSSEGRSRTLESRSLRAEQNDRPFAATTATSNNNCQINVAFSCGPYPIHENTCSALAALTTSEGTLAPLLVSQKTTSTSVQLPVGDAQPAGSTMPADQTNAKAGKIIYQTPTGSTTSSGQYVTGAIGLGVHLVQIFGNCANGSAAVAGT